MESILNLEDPTFDQGLVWRYTLSILLMQDGFSFCVSDDSDGQIKKINHYRETDTLAGYDRLLPAVSDELPNWKETGFKRVFMAFPSLRGTLIPEQFATGGNERLYLDFNFPGFENGKMLSTSLPVAGAVFVSEANHEVLSLAASLSENTRIIPSGAILIEALLRGNSHMNSRQVFIHKWHGYVEVIVIKGVKLLYHNTFVTTNASDLVYYVVFVLEQLGINPAGEQIFMLGETGESSEEFIMLSALLDNFTLYRKTFENLSSGLRPELDTSRYFALLSILTCGL